MFSLIPRYLPALPPLLLAVTLTTGSRAADSAAKPWAPFIEPDAPFISTVLDVRRVEGGWPTNNLTVRGLVLRLGENHWACFDTDLLRVSAIWEGNGVTASSLSHKSYQVPGDKADWGQDDLTRPEGALWLANGLYPGWQFGESVSVEDPRERAPDPRELGRGPLDRSHGEFLAIHPRANGAVLEYRIGETLVRERIEARRTDGQVTIQRTFDLGPVSEPLLLVLGESPEPVHLAIRAEEEAAVAQVEAPGSPLTVRVAPSASPSAFQVALSSHPDPAPWPPVALAPPAPRWPDWLTTPVEHNGTDAAYVIDHVDLPLDNPWRRNVRPADITFFESGRAAVCTIDGDVWLIDKLEDDANEARWKRFASGFHEPMGICVRDGELFVHDRNGVWRLVDENGDDEADVHRMFCNRFAQSGETREFALGLRLMPDNSFVLGKGGIQASTIGKVNGTVLRVAADGSSFETLATGLREPFIGVHPETGLITASDQQGNYVPSTPIHIIEPGGFYGFLSNLLPANEFPAPVTDALTWIPHPINPSGVGQVWALDPRMGPLAGTLLHLGYYRPEIFSVLIHDRGSRPQAAVGSISRDFDFPPLFAATNSRDGFPYVVGFQVWGTEAPLVAGLARVRYTGKPSSLPTEVAAMKRGVLIRFSQPVNADSIVPANFVAERWNYRRTPGYGSPHLKPDGSPGQESLIPSSAYLSRDGKSVFVGIPDMTPVMQMRLGWSLRSNRGAELSGNTWFTPHELVAFDPTSEGFAPLEVDLTPREAMAVAQTEPTVEEGKRLAELMGCVACHSTDGSTIGRVGTTWKGLFGSERVLIGNDNVIADEEYLIKSIKDPAAQIPREYARSDTGMPTYEGLLNDSQIRSIVLYIRSLE